MKNINDKRPIKSCVMQKVNVEANVSLRIRRLQYANAHKFCVA